MASMSPMMSPMASYGMVPHHHPMLHGSPAQVVPSSFFYPGHPVGTPVHHTTPGYHFGTPGQSVPMTPGSNTSPASSTSSTSSPSNTENQNQQSPHGQITSPYQHRLPHFSPYMPFSYPYGVCPPYYCWTIFIFFYKFIFVSSCFYFCNCTYIYCKYCTYVKMKYMPGYIGATQNFLHNSGAKIFGKRIHFYNKLTIIKKKVYSCFYHTCTVFYWMCILM
jgi:hypothetical protein